MHCAEPERAPSGEGKHSLRTRKSTPIRILTYRSPSSTAAATLQGRTPCHANHFVVRLAEACCAEVCENTVLHMQDDSKFFLPLSEGGEKDGSRLDLTERVEMSEYFVMSDEDYGCWKAEINAEVPCSSEGSR